MCKLIVLTLVFCVELLYADTSSTSNFGLTLESETILSQHNNDKDYSFEVNYIKNPIVHYGFGYNSDQYFMITRSRHYRVAHTLKPFLTFGIGFMFPKTTKEIFDAYDSVTQEYTRMNVSYFNGGIMGQLKFGAEYNLTRKFILGITLVSLSPTISYHTITDFSIPGFKSETNDSDNFTILPTVDGNLSLITIRIRYVFN